MPAIIPDAKKTTRNFFVPAYFSSMLPKTTKPERLYIICSQPEWMNMYVTRIHGCTEISAETSRNAAVISGNARLARKTTSIAAESFTAQNPKPGMLKSLFIKIII